jgi:exodeoxyribonuclease V alpha subunit
VSSTEVLAGLVERVTFHNAENGFCVLRVKARGQRDLITVLGHAAMISAGEFVQASGTWINDRTLAGSILHLSLRYRHPSHCSAASAGHGLVRGSALPAVRRGCKLATANEDLEMAADNDDPRADDFAPGQHPH